jgi:hypothetical protein
LAAVTSTEPTLWAETDAKAVPAIVEPSGGEVAELVELAERARNYARSSKSANTLRAYESDLRHFGAWCETRGLVAFPATAETVAYYLTDHGGVLAISTLRRRLAAIFHMAEHEGAGSAAVLPSARCSHGLEAPLAAAADARARPIGRGSS